MRRGLARAAAWDALVARLTASVKASIGETAVDVVPAPPPVSGLGAVFSGLMQHVGWSEGGKTCTAAPCEPYVRTGRLHTLDVLAAQRQPVEVVPEDLERGTPARMRGHRGHGAD